MYYQHLGDNELGFDAFIAPDDFDNASATQYSGDHPVDIYEIFKREYVLNGHARYIYYYSPGDYPLTLTPTATEYYRYGYTTGGTEVIVDVPLNGSPVTVFGETTSTKRWVIVCRPSSDKFSLTLSTARAEWLYCGDKINEVKMGVSEVQLKYIHFANLNSITGDFTDAFYNSNAPVKGALRIPESVTVLGNQAFYGFGSELVKIILPSTKNVTIYYDTYNTFGIVNKQYVLYYDFGASTYIPPNDTQKGYYSNLTTLMVSFQNTLYASFDKCDILYSKSLTTIVWIAPKTVRGIYIPDELPQSEIGTTGTGITTKLSTNIMQGYPLRIGALINNLTNLYLSNKSFTVITVGVGNTAFMVENNILYNTNKTTLIKAGTDNTGDIIIPNTVTTLTPYAFLRCTNYSNSITIGSGLTTIPSYAFEGLSGLTGKLTIPVSLTSIAANSISQLTSITSLEFSGSDKFNTSVYSDFSFATFSGQSLSDIITNDKLVNGTVGSPKYFFINQSSLDALNAYDQANGRNSIATAAGRYINIIQLQNEAKVFINNASLTDDKHKYAIANLVNELKSNNIYSKFYALYPLVGGVETSHKLNLINPSDSNDAYRISFIGSITHDSNGIKSTGGYGNLNFNPISVGCSLNNFQLSVYKKGTETGSKAYIGSASSTSNFTTLGFFLSGTKECGGIGGTSSELTPVTSNSQKQGFLQINTHNDRVAKHVVNGQINSSTSTQTASFQNVNMYILAGNWAGNIFGTCVASVLSFASISTGMSDSEISTFNTIVQNYQSTLGRQ